MTIATIQQADSRVAATTPRPAGRPGSENAQAGEQQPFMLPAGHSRSQQEQPQTVSQEPEQSLPEETIEHAALHAGDPARPASQILLHTSSATPSAEAAGNTELSRPAAPHSLNPPGLIEPIISPDEQVWTGTMPGTVSGAIPGAKPGTGPVEEEPVWTDTALPIAGQFTHTPVSTGRSEDHTAGPVQTHSMARIIREQPVSTSSQQAIAPASLPTSSMTPSSPLLSGIASAALMSGEGGLSDMVANRAAAGLLLTSTSGAAGSHLLTPLAGSVFGLPASEQSTGAPVAQWKSDTLPQQASQWGQKLVAMLGDKVQLQLGQQLQKAHIRLDPPQLGHIEIVISVEQDRTTVQLNASQQAVRDAMTQTLEQLRQTLNSKLGTQVDVSTGQQGQQHSREHSGERLTVDGQWESTAGEVATAGPAQSAQTATAWLDRRA